MRHLLYFGCIGVAGHYLWLTEGHTAGGHGSIFRSRSGIEGISESFINCMDGVYVPGHTREQGQYQVSVVPPFCIVAWHDFTVDKRPGSNSALLGIGYGGVEDIFADAIVKFPSVMKRQIVPLKPAPTWASIFR